MSAVLFSLSTGVVTADLEATLLCDVIESHRDCMRVEAEREREFVLRLGDSRHPSAALDDSRSRLVPT